MSSYQYTPSSAPSENKIMAHHSTRLNQSESETFSQHETHGLPSQAKGPNEAPETESEPSGLSAELSSYSAVILGFSIIILLPVAAAVFAVDSVHLAAIANEQSQVANQLTLLSLCAGNLVRRIYKRAW